MSAPGPRPHLVGLELDEPPEAFRALGFAVDADGAAVVGGIQLRFDGGARGLRSWTLTGVVPGPDGFDGLPTAVASAWEPARGNGLPTAHPNGALAVDHVVVATPDLARTVTAFEAAGFTVSRIRDAGTPEAPLRQAFLLTAEALVEIVGPPAPAGDGPARFWGVTFAVADLDAAGVRLGPLLRRPRDAVQPGRRIAAVAPEAGLSTPIAFMSPRVAT